MDLKAVVVSGEASESEDDSTSIVTDTGFPSIQTPKYCGTIISGEASESDDDGTSFSSAIEAVDAMACMPYAEVKIPKIKKCSIKYNSLLHKKLYECNKTLDKDLKQMVEGTVTTAIEELSNVNRQLLKNEMILQEAVCQLRTTCHRTKDASNALQQLIDSNFLYSIKT